MTKMKKCKPSFCLIVAVFFLVIGSTNCKKTNSRSDELLGKWISTDLVDTLEIASDHDLYKMVLGVKDHYNYSLTGDSILITYNGVAMPYIFIGPSKMRFYELDGTNLTIDFRNAYYGFSNQIILFHRR
jgi:hypothetical protein